MRHERVIEARVVCRDDDGAVLVVDGQLPGGLVGPGEHPAEVAASTGAHVRRPVRVVTNVHRVPGRRDAWRHRDTIVFEGDAAAVRGGSWVAPAGLAGSELGSAVGLASASVGLAASGPTGITVRSRQRFGAYGHVTDPEGNVLLTLIAEGYPGAGRWHLPGGGTDFGEGAEAALHREIAEETGQAGEIGDLLRVNSLPVWEGRHLRFHGVRVVYAFRVARPTAARVLEHNGSTAAAAWLTLDAARELTLTDIARELVG